MSERTPQAGDWYEKENCRVRIVGFRLDGVAITETIGGFIGCIEYFSGWKHLPGCDSFEWQEPLKVSAQLTPHNGEPITAQDVAEIEREESPEDWVTQDRVPARPGIDERAYQTVGESSIGDWRDCSCMSWNKMPRHGHKHGDCIINLRCRRKDLPPLPTAQPTANHTCCTIDASGQHELKERKKTVTFHEVVVLNQYVGRQIQWVEHPRDNVRTGRTRTEVVE